MPFLKTDAGQGKVALAFKIVSIAAADHVPTMAAFINIDDGHVSMLSQKFIGHRAKLREKSAATKPMSTHKSKSNYPALWMLGMTPHLGFGFKGIDRRITVRKGRKSFFAMNRFRLNARGPIMRKISRSSRMRSRNGFMGFSKNIRFCQKPSGS